MAGCAIGCCASVCAIATSDMETAASPLLPDTTHPTEELRRPMEEPVVRPGDLALDELRRIGSSVVDAIAEYHDGLDGRPVLPCVTPAEVAASFSGRLPAEGEPG